MTKKPTTDELLYIATEHTTFFKDKLHNLHAILTIDGKSTLIDVPSDHLKNQLRKLFIKHFHTTIDSASINTVQDYLIALGDDPSTPTSDYFPRVAQHQDAYYYNLANEQNQLVKITKDGVTINENGDHHVCFKPMIAQVTPDLNAQPNTLLELLRPLFRVQDDDQLLLLTTYIVSCLVYDINHPVLVIYGSHGSAKSTTVDTIAKIVDPNKSHRISLSNDNRSLTATLSNRYFTAFDNLEVIKQCQSNIFCLVSTGGYVSLRELFTTNQDKQYDLRGCLCLNGIDIPVVAGDLLDRSILIELCRIPDNKYLTEKEYNANLAAVLPAILGACFQTLHKAMQLYDTVTYTPKGRMADFIKWGYCIAEAIMPNGGDRFETAYLVNKNLAKAEAKLPLVLDCIISLMKNNAKWQGSMSDLREALQPIARYKGYKTAEFPASASSLSRQIGNLKKELMDNKIEFSQKNGGNRLVTLLNKDYTDIFAL